MRCLATVLIVSFVVGGTLRADEAPRFEIEVSPVLLRGVPVRKVEIRAVDSEGTLDAAFGDVAQVDGLELRSEGEVVSFPPFHEGRLVLPFDPDDATPAEKRRTLHLTGGPITVGVEGGDTQRAETTLVPGWLSLVPPVLAIVLAVWWRQVLAALFLGLLGGTLVLAVGDPLAAMRLALSGFVLQAIVDPGDVLDYPHMHVILFTTFLGSLVAVMFASGGTTALVGSLRPLLHTRERTQLGTMLLGVLVFFDDYANTLLVGTTMRPVTDRQRISREKLAFLVDATAAPIAGLAIVSTWVGFEIGLIAQAYRDLNLETDVYGTFIATLPYRFYPLLLLVFVAMTSATGRDFGPMLRAERRALETGATSRPGANVPQTPEVPELGSAGSSGNEPRMINALLPLGFLLSAIAFGLYWTGTTGLAGSNAGLPVGEPGEATTFASVLGHADSYVVLLYASFLASLLAVGSAVVTRASTLTEATNAWVEGVKQMLPAVLVLVLAWALAAVCDGEHLNTAGYLVATTTGWVTAEWMPTLAFLLAAGVSFATGTSWATMGLLIPLFIPYTHDLLAVAGGEAVDPNAPLMLATIGAVLAGAIFGDHCSPISDTTVLSSAASGCDHLDHVGTQLPYALSVGAIGLVTCSAPVAFGVSPYVGLAAGMAAVIGLVWCVGRRASEGRDDSVGEATSPSDPA